MPELSRRIVAAIDATATEELDDVHRTADVDDVRRMLNICIGMLTSAACESVRHRLVIQALRTALFGSRTLVPERAARRLNAELERIVAMSEAELWPVHRTGMLASIDALEREG